MAIFSFASLALLQNCIINLTHFSVFVANKTSLACSTHVTVWIDLLLDHKAVITSVVTEIPLRYSVAR